VADKPWLVFTWPQGNAKIALTTSFPLPLRESEPPQLPPDWPLGKEVNHCNCLVLHQPNTLCKDPLCPPIKQETGLRRAAQEPKKSGTTPNSQQSSPHPNHRSLVCRPVPTWWRRQHPSGPFPPLVSTANSQNKCT
jgi:hypothetical protein